MKAWTTTILKLYWGAYFIVASLYCFLAFTPFTYLFVIVNPPYPWISQFARYSAPLLWFAVAASIFSRWPRIWKGMPRVMTVAELSLALIATIHNPISHIQNNVAAFAWGVAFLLPPLIAAVYDCIRRATLAHQQTHFHSIAYSNAIYIGLLTGLISIAAPRLYSAAQAGFLLVQRYDAELIFWVVIEHVTVAISVATIINLARSLLVRRTRNSFILGHGVIGLVVFVGLAFGCFLYFEDSLSLRGWAAGGYAVLLAATVTFSGLALPVPFLSGEKSGWTSRWLPAMAAILLIGFAIYLPLTIDQADDWNGIIHQLFTLMLWFVLALSICRLRSLQKQYSITTILAVGLITCGAYEGLNQSKPVWAADLGANKGEILRQLNNYSAQNTSFGLVDTILGNQNGEPCDEGCKTLRQYSNIRNAKIPRELNLVENLSPTTISKPNIFIIVIDSLRPDYLGVYNPRVDFTPNLDAFARDSIAMRRAFTDYAGTSLSEPSIWSGGLLLHAHYAQPFQKVNSLEKLAHIDGYQIVLSYDVILRELIAPSNDIVRLDTDEKDWGQIEISSTIKQLENYLDRRPPQAPPVLFYTQPMNVQIHSTNNLPKRTSQNWVTRQGFDDRIAFALHQADQFLGDFFSYLKSKNLYDNSIIIVTADHGDATKELGRTGHSIIIYPEVMHVPLIIHLPQSMRDKYVYDEGRLSTLTDIAPSLYYLLGHRPIEASPLVGRPMFLSNAKELLSYPRPDLLLASDSLAAYGILSGDGRWMYTTYDAPSRSMLFDLTQDPKAQHNVLTSELKKQYDDRILQYLQLLSKFYGYQPSGGKQ